MGASEVCFSIRIYDLKNMTEFLLSWEDPDWMYVAQNRDKCRGIANTLMNLQAKTCGEFLEKLRKW